MSRKIKDGKQTIYIRVHHEERWLRLANKSDYVNKKLDEEAEAEKRDPIWLEDEKRWSDAEKPTT